MAEKNKLHGQQKKLIIEMLMRNRIHKGDSLTRAAALAGNIYVESGGDPTRKQGDSKIPDKEWFAIPEKIKIIKDGEEKWVYPGRGTGIAQWDDRRRTRKKEDKITKAIGLEEFAKNRGEPWSDVDVQLDFLDYEIAGDERGSWKKVDKRDNYITKQTTDIRKYFFRPGKPHDPRRIKHAKRFKKKYRPMPQEIKDTKAKASMYGLAKHLHKKRNRK